jgi:predicted ATPase
MPRCSSRPSFSALRVPEQAEQPLAAALISFVKQRELLLVLDNCEHLAAACAHLVEILLAHSPQLHILATSREALGTPGETLWLLPPWAYLRLTSR